MHQKLIPAEFGAEQGKNSYPWYIGNQLVESLRISQFSWNDFTRTFVHVYIAYGCVTYRRAVMEAAVSTYRRNFNTVPHPSLSGGCLVLPGRIFHAEVN